MKIKNLAQVSKEDVRSLADSKIFQRGAEYFAEGAVVNPVVNGNEISAEVEGSASSNYKTTVRLEKGKLECECDCPYDWGVCKHVIAFLLHWMKRRDEFEDLGAKVSEVGKMPRADLVRIVETLAKEEPQVFSQVLDLALPGKALRAAGEKDYSPQVARLLERGAEWREMPGLLRQLRAFRQRVLARHDGDGNDYVAGQLFKIARAVMEGYGSCDDSSGSLSDFVNECVEGILSAWGTASEKTRQGILLDAWSVLVNDEYGFDDILVDFLERACRSESEREALRKPIIQRIAMLEDTGAKKTKGFSLNWKYEQTLGLAKKFGYIDKKGICINRD